MAINYEEKRDFQRMTIECDITFTLENRTDKHYGKGSDLSATGVMFSTDQDLAMDSIINVDVHPYIKTVQPLSAKGKVIRNQKSGNDYIIGIEMFDVQ